MSSKIPDWVLNTSPEWLHSIQIYQFNLVFATQCRKSLCLFMCLHFEISSVLLLRMLFPLNNAISNFSFRQRLHLSDERWKRELFLRILHFILGTEFLRFIFQNSFASSVSLLYAAKLKDLLWVTISFFKCCFCYTFSQHVILSSYTIFSAWQFPFSGQSFFLLQLHFPSFGHCQIWCKTDCWWLILCCLYSCTWLCFY